MNDESTHLNDDVTFPVDTRYDEATLNYFNDESVTFPVGTRYDPVNLNNYLNGIPHVYDDETFRYQKLAFLGMILLIVIIICRYRDFLSRDEFFVHM